MVFALNGDGIADLLSYLCAKMPNGPWALSEDQASELPMRSLQARSPGKTVPASTRRVALRPRQWKRGRLENPEGRQRTGGTDRIYVNARSQKKIVMGKGGAEP